MNEHSAESDAGPVTEYVVGFLMDTRRQEVALIRKNRPEWQAGRLNGIGGHVEPGERPYEAMCREFFEETGLAVRGWKTLVVMDFPGARITFYRTSVPASILHGVRSMTDEEVGVYPLHMVRDEAFYPIIPNLSWLLPLAAYTADEYAPIPVRAAMAEALTSVTPPAVPRDRAPRNYAEQRALLDDSLRDIPPGGAEVLP